VRDEPRITVEAEDPPERMLLETKICKEDGFQKQQGTHGKRALMIILANSFV
jgi:protein phosphatase-4 regulatory subunit 3